MVVGSRFCMGCAIVLLFACSGPSEGGSGPEVSAAAEVLGFERASDWTSSSGAALLPDLDATQGARALRLKSSGRSALTSRSFYLDAPPSRISVDIRLGELLVDDMGQIEAGLDCPSLGLFDVRLDGAELASLATGRFETISFAVPPPLQQRLERGCGDAILRFDLKTGVDLGEIAFDRVRLGSRVDIIASELCGMDQPEADAEEELPNGYFRRHSWRSGASVQDELARLQQAFQSTPGVLGLAADDANHRFVAVMDPEAGVDIETVRDELLGWEPTLTLAVQPSCRGGAELARALDVIREGAFHPRATQVQLWHYLDVEDSRYVVLVDPDDRDVGEALEAELGPLVSVRYDRIVKHSRANDGEPHYGGAELQNVTYGAECTSGFAVTRQGVLGSVTAGKNHCFGSLGEPIYSGVEYYGEAGAFTASLGWDMAFITPDGETFSPHIHTTPCCPSVRKVSSTTPPANNQVVCISGTNFLAKCSVSVITMMSTMSIGGTTRNNVWIGRRSGVNIGAPGDSGAPIYVPLAGDKASIVGMHIGGFLSAPFEETWFHSVSDITAQLGVSVAF